MITTRREGYRSPAAERQGLTDQVKRLWCALADETVTGLPAATVAALPGILKTLTGNVDAKRPGRRHGR